MPEPTATRTILHVDMDAFYASVEQRDDPAIRGLPVVVGGTGNRGVVAAASYESRRFGIHSAMPMREALRRCPDLHCIWPRMSHYKSVSATIFEIFAEFTPLVEGLSLDEAYLDVSASVRLLGSGHAMAKAIKARIREVTGLCASVGVAQNKLLAKIASDLDKPDGLVVIDPQEVNARLDPLPVRAIPGIGRETEQRLAALGVTTVGALRHAPDAVLQPVFGRYTPRMRERVSGIDERPVVPWREEKSISAECTFDEDLHTTDDIDRELLRLAEQAASRLRRAKLFTSTVVLKIRRADFRTYTRQRTLRPPGNGTRELYDVASALLSEWRAKQPDARIRLLGIGGSQLSEHRQDDLFAVDKRGDDATIDKSIDGTIDSIRQRFGEQSVGRAKLRHQ